jgi:spore germination cell wall hydrolase CwlJ-like protein
MSLTDLVNVHRTGAELDEQGQCLATAVYFESMGEPLEGQLAVANVVINRAKSGRYPTSWCGVVKQKAQFSFVRSGRFPRIDHGCDAWAKAQAIARIAALNLTSALPQDVLWYHADYVAPRWCNNLRRVEKIGAHIFYRG